jgi:hypothetical protein
VSNSDSFIDEVTEEVRRERLFGMVRRYGWIAVVLVLVLVGGAAWNEWRKAEARAEAEAFGDALLAALNAPDRAARAEALSDVAAPDPAGQAVVTMLAAAEASEGSPAEAAEHLLALADAPDTPQVYRQLATLKAVSLGQEALDIDTRRQRAEGLLLAGGMVRLLAEEQMALIEIEAGDRAAALERLNRIAEDAEATAGLRQRASQLIVALGGEVQG